MPTTTTSTDIEDDLRRIWVAIRVRYMRTLEELAEGERRDYRKHAAVLLEQAIDQAQAKRLAA
jgi:hypothetical protein